MKKFKFNFRILILLIIILTVSVLAVVAQRTIEVSKLTEQARSLYVDFDESMQKDKYMSVFKEPVFISIYELFKSIYARNNLSVVKPTAAPKVPKIIHQIWLGSPFPEEFKKYQETWKAMHPDWEYKLWDEDTIVGLVLHNQDLFNASLNYGEKSDILRYELLYQFGGVYVDVDFECLKPLDILNHCYEFYIGIQPMDTGYVQLGIGLIGSKPGHPLLDKSIKAIRENKYKEIVARTGPLHFTKMFIDYEVTLPLTKDIALPPTYFYPKGFEQRGFQVMTWLCPESFAVHHWAGSWLKPQAVVRTPVSRVTRK